MDGNQNFWGQQNMNRFHFGPSADIEHRLKEQQQTAKEQNSNLSFTPCPFFSDSYHLTSDNTLLPSEGDQVVPSSQIQEAFGAQQKGAKPLPRLPDLEEFMSDEAADGKVVNMEFEGGLTAAFSMVTYTEICNRKTTIYGSKGELSYSDQEICVFDFLTEKTAKHTASCDSLRHYGMGGHGGADYHLMNAFILAVANNDPSLIRSGPEETLVSHLLVFEAEIASGEQGGVLRGL